MPGVTRSKTSLPLREIPLCFQQPMAFVSRNAISSMIDAAAPPAQLLSGCTTLNDALAGRGTKIIATMGPAVRSPTTLDELLQAGVSCVRLDVSCAESAQWFLDSYAMIQGAIKRNQRLCAVMLDTRGEHEVTVRRGVLGAAASKGPQMPLHIHAEQVLTLLGESSAKWLPEHPELLPVSEPAFVASLSVGDIVYSSRYLGTGMESASTYLEVMRISDDRKQAECRAMTEAVFGASSVVAAHGFATLTHLFDLRGAHHHFQSCHSCKACGCRRCRRRTER